MRAKTILTLVAVLTLACLSLYGCAGQNPAAGATAEKEVSFLDTRGFDRKLSASLSVNEPKVDVLFPALITLNNIPDRMDKWLSMVEQNGGKVEIQPEPEEGRGIITEIFSIFIKAFEAAEERALYAPSKLYNVRIIYKGNTGIVSRMSFLRKPDAPASPAPKAEKQPPATGGGGR